MKVKLISKSQPNVAENNSEFIAYVARISSERLKDNRTLGYKNLIKYLIDNKHWSPFEHAYLTFEIETSLAIATQLLRHRSLTFQQLSKRYNKHTPLCEPVELRVQSTTNRQCSGKRFVDKQGFYDRIDSLQNQCLALYTEMIEAGVANECARFILPQSTQTELIITGSFRSWLHFLEARLDTHAQKEIRSVADKINEILRIEFADIFNA